MVLYRCELALVITRVKLKLSYYTLMQYALFTEFTVDVFRCDMNEFDGEIRST